MFPNRGLLERLTLAVLVFVLAAAPAEAQFRRSETPFAEKGDLALLVEVSGLDDLRLQSALNGVGVRYRVADQTAVGLSVGLNVNSVDTEGGFEFDGTSVRATTWFEQHVGRPSRTVSPFVGAGVQFRGENGTTTDPGDGISNERSLVAVGGGVLFGAEVRLAKAVTLGAAYTLGVEYVRRDETFRSDLGDPVSRATDELRVGTGLSNLGLSVYF